MGRLSVRPLYPAFTKFIIGKISFVKKKKII